MLDSAQGLKLERGVKFPPTPSNPLYPLDRLTKKRKLFKKWREGPVSGLGTAPIGTQARERVGGVQAQKPAQDFLEK